MQSGSNPYARFNPAIVRFTIAIPFVFIGPILWEALNGLKLSESQIEAVRPYLNLLALDSFHVVMPFILLGIYPEIRNQLRLPFGNRLSPISLIPAVFLVGGTLWWAMASGHSTGSLAFVLLLPVFTWHMSLQTYGVGSLLRRQGFDKLSHLVPTKKWHYLLIGLSALGSWAEYLTMEVSLLSPVIGGGLKVIGATVGLMVAGKIIMTERSVSGSLFSPVPLLSLRYLFFPLASCSGWAAIGTIVFHALEYLLIMELYFRQSAHFVSAVRRWSNLFVPVVGVLAYSVYSVVGHPHPLFSATFGGLTLCHYFLDGLTYRFSDSQLFAAHSKILVGHSRIA